MTKTKLKSEYGAGDLPEPCLTSCDIENQCPTLNTPQVLDLFRLLRNTGIGEIFTQCDAMAPAGEYEGDIVYSRGVRFINRTGVYAFVFGNFSPEKVGGEGKTRRKNGVKRGV